MPILPDLRDEFFAQCLAAGMGPRQAAAAAGVEGEREGAAPAISAAVARRAEEVRGRLARAGLPPLEPPGADWPASALAMPWSDIAERLTAAALMLSEEAAPSVWRDGAGGSPAPLAVTSWRLH